MFYLRESGRKTILVQQKPYYLVLLKEEPDSYHDVVCLLHPKIIEFTTGIPLIITNHHKLQ